MHNLSQSLGLLQYIEARPTRETSMEEEREKKKKTAGSSRGYEQQGLIA